MAILPLKRLLQARVRRAAGPGDPDLIGAVRCHDGLMEAELRYTGGAAANRPVVRSEIPEMSARVLMLSSQDDLEITGVASHSWTAHFPRESIGVDARALGSWMKKAGFRPQDLKAFSEQFRKRGSDYAVGRISQAVKDDYLRFLCGEMTSADHRDKGRRAAANNPQRFLAWMQAQGLDVPRAERQRARFGDKVMLKHHDAFMRAYGKWVDEDGSLGYSAGRDYE